MADQRQTAKPAESDGRSTEPTHAKVAWEPRDASFQGVFAVAIGVCITGAILFSAMQLFYRQAEQLLATRKASGFPLAPQPSQQPPASPRLEPIDQMDHLEAANPFHKLLEQERELHRYGDTAEAGFVSIPIERAMQIAAKRLPVQDPLPARDKRESELLDAGESNSGRVFRGDLP